MAKKPTVLDDTEIVTRVVAKAKESVGWYDSKLSKERERVLNYYNGTYPKRQHDGSSSYVSTDVYDAVEMMKAQLLETFAGGDDIARFDPDQDMNEEACKVATEYASYVIFRENNGFSVFNDVIHDGLTARAGIAKVFWEEKYSYSEETFEGLSQEDATALASQEDVDEFDGTLDEQTGLYNGTLCRKYDVSKVSIVAVAPEEFLIESRAISLALANYVGQRTRKTKAELVDMGYDRKVVAGLHHDEGNGLEDSPEVLARNAPLESAQGLNNPIQDELESVMLYESYVRMQIDSAKGVRLYRIVHVNNVLLEKQEVDKAPFLAYVPLPIPHLFYGNNFAARVIPTQNARTVLTRAVLDHSAISVNPRWMVVNGGLLNPREMLENRMGGLVNVRRTDSVAPMPQNNLNPYVFEVLGMLRDDKEQSTGISSLSQGLNKDAISKQNSQGLVGDLVTLSGQRQKIAARNFAYGFFVELMLEVIRLVILNEKKAKVIEVAGSPLQVDPRAWTARTTCSVSMHLGYGEKDKAVAKLSGAYQMLAQDPAIQPMFTAQNRYNMISDGLKMSGMSASRYLTAPDKVEPPKPDPLKVRELDIKDKSAEAALIQAKAAVGKDQRMLIHDAQRIDLDKQKLAVTALDSDRTNDRQDLETAARIDVAQREMALQEKMPDASRKAIVSPNP